MPLTGASPAWRSRDVLRVTGLVFGVYLALRLFWVAKEIVFLAFIGVLFGLTLSAAAEKARGKFGLPVAVGAPVSIVADPYERQTFNGKVVRVVHNLDPRTRTMGVEVDIPNSDGKLKPGMFARVEVSVDSRKQALTIPMEALRVGEARPSVMVVRNGVVEAVSLELGVSDGQVVEVRRGLGDQDEVILQGKDLVKPRQKVRTVPATRQ